MVVDLTSRRLCFVRCHGFKLLVYLSEARAQLSNETWLIVILWLWLRLLRLIIRLLVVGCCCGLYKSTSEDNYLAHLAGVSSLVSKKSFVV